MDFEDYFKDILGDRKQISNLLDKLVCDYLNLSYTLDIIPFTSSQLDEDDNVIGNELPGFQVFIKVDDINYSYLLFELSLPEVGEFPVDLEMRTLSDKKTAQLMDLESLDTYLRNAFESLDYQLIVTKILHTSGK